MSRWRLYVYGVLVALAGCASEAATQVLVIVDSDLPPEARPESIHLSASLAGVHMEELTGDVAVHGLPLSFALVHGGGATGPLRIRIEGRRAQQVVVAREAELEFSENQILVLRMDLYRNCVDVVCEAQNSCTELGCVSAAEAGARVSTWQGTLGTLEPWRGDASSSPDAGFADAGDAQSPQHADALDARLDAETMVPNVDAEAKLDGSLNGASLGNCSLFPGNSVWNVDVSGSPPAAESTTYINAWGGDTPLSLQFGVDTGVLWTSVTNNQAAVAVQLAKPNVPVTWPVPLSYALDESLARRLVVVNTATCMLYEALGCERFGNAFACETGAAVGLAGSWVRQPGSVMAQDSALALLPGLVRVEEVRKGAIDHALSMTMSALQRGFVAPALNHLGGLSPSPNLAPMGVRLRLRASYSEAGLGEAAKVVIRAMKTHGVLVTHRGSAFGLQGERHADWGTFDLQELTNIKASDFDVLNHGVINL